MAVLKVNGLPSRWVLGRWCLWCLWCLWMGRWANWQITVVVVQQVASGIRWGVVPGPVCLPACLGPSTGTGSSWQQLDGKVLVPFYRPLLAEGVLCVCCVGAANEAGRLAWAGWAPWRLCGPDMPGASGQAELGWK